jgi:hypothetical protein
MSTPRQRFCGSVLSIHLRRFGDKRPADPQAHRKLPCPELPERILDLPNE